MVSVTQEPSIQPRDTAYPEIEVWENAYPNRDYTITIEIPEFTSVCPKTGLPDFGTLIVEYSPQAWCLELKALKYYILAYRNQGIFYERVVNQVLEHLTEASKPRWMKVTGTFTPRGGIKTTVMAEYKA